MQTLYMDRWMNPSSEFRLVKSWWKHLNYKDASPLSLSKCLFNQVLKKLLYSGGGG